MRVEGTKVIVLFDPTIDATYTLHLKDKTYDQYSAGGGKYSTSIAAYGNSNHIDTPGVSGPVQVVKWGQIPYHSEPVTNVDTIQLGLQTINGLACKGTRVTLTIPAHAVGNDRDIHVVNERWYSDDLKVLVKSSNDDPRFGTSTYELKDVSRAEPDSSLSNFPQASPAAIAAEPHPYEILPQTMPSHLLPCLASRQLRFSGYRPGKLLQQLI